MMGSIVPLSTMTVHHVNPLVHNTICYIQSILLVTESLLTFDSITELAMRRCVLGKDTLRIFPSGGKQATHYGGLAWRLAETKQVLFGWTDAK